MDAGSAAARRLPPRRPRRWRSWPRLLRGRQWRAAHVGSGGGHGGGGEAPPALRAAAKAAAKAAEPGPRRFSVGSGGPGTACQCSLRGGGAAVMVGVGEGARPGLPALALHNCNNGYNIFENK